MMIEAMPDPVSGMMASPKIASAFSTPRKPNATPRTGRKRMPLGDCRLETPVNKPSHSRALRSSARKSRRLVNSSEIEQRVVLLFGGDVLALPCVSARLVACYSLQTAIFLPSQGLLWKLCGALVRVEAASLHNTRTPQSSPTRPQRTSFCSFDCSSSLPPVDRIDGSEEYQHKLIDALVDLKRALLEFETAAAIELDYLKQLISFMNDQEHCIHWQQECTRSISESYPLKRLQLAWKQYLADFETLCTRIAAMKIAPQQSAPPLLSFECRLAHFIGQAIRRELRNVLNPPPPRFCSKDSTYEERAMTYSQAYVHIHFSGPQGAAAGDKNLASLVSTALRQLYDYFGHQILLQANPTALLLSIPTEFCTKTALLDPITSDNESQAKELFSGIIDDLDQACLFLAAANACRFLVELFSIPNVQSEVERRGGWSQLETYAALSWQYQLFDIVEEDAHFVILANVGAFFSTMRSCHDALMLRAKDCQKSLTNLTNRHRLNTKNHSLVKKYPHLRVIQERLELGREHYQIFPRVSSSKLSKKQKQN